MSGFGNGNILSTPSCFIRQCKINIQNCHFCKRCNVRCHINWVQDFYLMFCLNLNFLLIKSWKKMLTLILLNPQVYQAPESVMVNQRVNYFHDLGLSYFYSIKAMSWITGDYLQQTIYVKTKSRIQMCIKKQTSTKLPRPYNLSLGK